MGRGSFEVPGNTDLGQEKDEPFGRVPVIPLDAVAVIIREFMMKVVIPLSIRENGAELMVPR